MGLFSQKKQKHISIHHESSADNSEPILSDIVDLRAMRHKSLERFAPAISHAKTKPSSLEERQKTIQDFFKRKSSSVRLSEGGEEMFAFLQFNPKYKKFYLGLAIVLVGGLMFMLISTAFSSATIVIEPKHENIKLENIALTVDPALALPDISTKRIPGEKVEYTEDIYIALESSGEKYVESKARGIITVQNLSSTAPQTIVANTRFQDAGTGKIVRLTSELVIPPAKNANGKISPAFIDAEVIADAAGEEHNDLKGPFTIPGFKGTAKFQIFGAVVKEPMAHGFRGSSKIATKDDIAKAETMFIDEARRVLADKRDNSIPKDFKVVNSAEHFEILSKSASRAGEPGINVIIKGKARISNVVFKEKALLELLNSILHKDVANIKYPSAEKSSLAYNAVFLGDGDKLNFTVSGNLNSVWLVNRALIATSVAGKTIDEAKNILRYVEGVRAFGIKLFPFWNKTLPRDASKLNVELANS